MARRGRMGDAPEEGGDKDAAVVLRDLCVDLISAWVSERAADLKPADLDVALRALPRGDRDTLTGALGRFQAAPAQVAAPSAAPLTMAAPQTTEAILDAATQVFLERGYGANLDAVAREARISKRTIYTHFASKEHLFRAAIERLKVEMVVTINWDQSGDVGRDLIDYGRKIRACVLSEPILKISRLSEIGASGEIDLGAIVETHTQEFYGYLTTYFREGIKQGVFRDCDPSLLAEQFYSTVLGQARSRALRGVEVDPARGDAYLEQAVAMFLRGALGAGR